MFYYDKFATPSETSCKLLPVSKAAKFENTTIALNKVNLNKL